MGGGVRVGGGVGWGGVAGRCVHEISVARRSEAGDCEHA